MDDNNGLDDVMGPGDADDDSLGEMVDLVDETSGVVIHLDITETSIEIVGVDVPGTAPSDSMPDLDDDGMPDVMQTPDMDGDGVPDPDLDGDGIPDTDANQDGVPDLDVDQDHIPDMADPSIDVPAPVDQYDPDLIWDPNVPVDPSIPVPEPEIQSPWDNFDPSAIADEIIGDPASAIDDWHVQQAPDTCAVVSQEFILDDLLDRDVTEEELVQQAIDAGVYTPGGGTAPQDVGVLIELAGFEVERTEGGTLDDLAQHLANGDKIIVGLDADELWTPGQDADDAGMDPNTLPGQGANHAVEVIGIDKSDPGNPLVILNDPGHPDGQGMMVPASVFDNAWSDSNRFVMTTTGQPVAA